MNNKLATSLFLALMLAGLWLFAVQKSATAVSNGTLCVNKTGIGGCYTSIQTAIDDANPNDRIDVDSGTYSEHITITKDLELVGKGWENTIIDGGYSSAQSVLYVEWGISATTIISGFQITGGGSGISATSTQDGGGIHISHASPKIINTWVYSCTANNGGGVSVDSGSPYFENVPAWFNQAYERGGGFYLGNSAEVTMIGDPFAGTNGTVWWNKAGEDGGGICTNLGASANILGLRIYWNSADPYHSISSGSGGGVAIENASDPVWLTLNDISGNSAKRGAGIYTLYADQLELNANLISNNTSNKDGGGAFLILSQGNFNINIVAGNHATSGAGGGLNIASAGTTINVTSNRIESNDAAAGGGINVEASAIAQINSNTIISNSAGIGGGIYLWDTGALSVTNNIIAFNDANFAGIFILDTGPVIVNNTIVENIGEGVGFTNATGMNLYNNIIAWNSNDGIEWNEYPQPSTIDYQMDYNDVYNNFGLNYKNIPSSAIGAHDVSVDPVFIATGDAFNYYHLQNSSPVRNAGYAPIAPLRDIDGEVRLLNGLVSMGADEIEFPVYLPIILRNFP
jgi:hypothetical protein